MILIKVVLPQPLGPRSETNSFFRMAREILYRATNPGFRESFSSKKTLLSCRTSNIHPSKDSETLADDSALTSGPVLLAPGRQNDDQRTDRKEEVSRDNQPS